MVTELSNELVLWLELLFFDAFGKYQFFGAGVFGNGGRGIFAKD